MKNATARLFAVCLVAVLSPLSGIQVAFASDVTVGSLRCEYGVGSGSYRFGSALNDAACGRNQTNLNL